MSTPISEMITRATVSLTRGIVVYRTRFLGHTFTLRGLA